MLWLAADPESTQEVMLTMPRTVPAGAPALAHWLLNARRAARLDHPNLARVLEIGVHEHWPFIAVDRSLGVTLEEWLQTHSASSADEAAAWVSEALRGLSFAHEAGVAHLDLQVRSLIVSERGQVCVMALAAACEPTAAPTAASVERAMALDPVQLRVLRAAAERDVVACGIMLHSLLVGEPALGDADNGRVLDRMAPGGRELVRLPWSLRGSVSEALRAIVNRSTSGQPGLRYRNARTLLDALEGWRASQSNDDGGPLALLLERLRSVGHLPALPGLTGRVQRVLGLEGQRTDDIASQILPDMALSFELLRTLNSAQVQGTQVAGSGPVLTLSRVVALIGVNGVRQAASALRPWPGPLDEVRAAALHKTFDRVRLAGHTAQALRPPGYDAESVYLVAVLQNLGRLMIRYHFPEQSEQIQQLLQAVKEPTPTIEGEAEEPALSEEAAAFTVLGVDVESFGAAVGRHWGLGAELQHMIRRLPLDVPVRKPDGDSEVLRIVASAANEVVDAFSESPPERLGAALAHIAQRYSRVLSVDARGMGEALKEAREVFRSGSPPPRGGRSQAGADSRVDGAERGSAGGRDSAALQR